MTTQKFNIGDRVATPDLYISFLTGTIKDIFNKGISTEYYSFQNDHNKFQSYKYTKELIFIKDL